MMNDAITLVEVSARDGLQNEKTLIATEDKLAHIESMVQAGVSIIEATSFVSPKWVPQMADHETIMRSVDHTKARFPALVPNLKGFEAAKACGVKDIAVFAACSQTFSQKNINCSIEQSLERFEQVIEQALAANMRVRGYLSCVLGCPYEGEVSMDKVLELAVALLEKGCYEVSLGDTIGVGTPHQVRALLKHLEKDVPLSSLAVHFHDTYGQALANVFESIESGIRVIDASNAGLGGCPYAKGASGNVATEDVLYLCQGLGLKTDIDLLNMVQAGQRMCDLLSRPNGSKVARAMLAKQQ